MSFCSRGLRLKSQTCWPRIFAPSRIGALDQLGLTHLSQRLDDLAGGSVPTASDRILFGARSRKQREK